jgi:hypothetical protein
VKSLLRKLLQVAWHILYMELFSRQDTPVYLRSQSVEMFSLVRISGWDVFHRRMYIFERRFISQRISIFSRLYLKDRRMESVTPSEIYLHDCETYFKTNVSLSESTQQKLFNFRGHKCKLAIKVMMNAFAWYMNQHDFHAELLRHICTESSKNNFDYDRMYREFSISVFEYEAWIVMRSLHEV